MSTMDAQELINQCERRAKAYSSDLLASQAHEIGALRYELRKACNLMGDGARPEDYRVAVVFGEARAISTFTLDSSDDICLTGVWVNGADIQLGMTDEQLRDVEDQIQRQWHAVDKQIRERNADMLIDRVAA